MYAENVSLCMAHCGGGELWGGVGGRARERERDPTV